MQALENPRARFERYVAIGDSSTEGLDDPDGRGGYRGWADRLAEHIALSQGDLLYANLGVRGRVTRQVREQQLAQALAMRPDLATVFTGTNDLLSLRFDVPAIANDMEVMQRTLIVGGATVLTFTLPDLSPVMPLARPVSPRIRAMNEALRRVAASTGAILIDFAVIPVATDSRLWSADHIHANAWGHTLIAEALAEAIGLPGTDDSWRSPLPSLPPATQLARLSGELFWLRRHVLPWIKRSLRHRDLEATRKPKRPELEVVRREALATPLQS
jgi:lysophospholipase L1-like esterase